MGSRCAVTAARMNPFHAAPDASRARATRRASAESASRSTSSVRRRAASVAGPAKKRGRAQETTCQTHMGRSPRSRALHSNRGSRQPPGQPSREHFTGIHGLTQLVRAVEENHTTGPLVLCGAPTRNREEICAAIERYQEVTAGLGRTLAERFGFEYPAELEAVTRREWQAFRASR